MSDEASSRLRRVIEYSRQHLGGSVEISADSLERICNELDNLKVLFQTLVADEREACAKIADEFQYAKIAKIIRARSKPKVGK